MKIKGIKAKKILNSRNKPTIEIHVSTTNGKFSASAPSGASKGASEVKYFPSNSVDQAVLLTKKINKWLKGFTISNIEDFEKLESVLKEYDNSKKWIKIGGNTIIALEFALLKALSNNEIWKFLNPDAYNLPTPIGNCIGGGAHASKVKNPPDFQEFLVIAQTDVYHDAMFANKYVYNNLVEKIKKLDPKYNLQKTDEGAYSPNLPTMDILNILSEATEEASKELGFKMRMGLDIAASQLWNGKNYEYNQPPQKLTKDEQIHFIERLSKQFNLFYIEDPLHETDFQGFAKLKKSTKSIICGDDLTVSHISLLENAIKKDSINAILVKPNQVGSLYETIKLVELAKSKGIIPIISHRSGETMDTTIADLAVGLEIPYIKISIKGKERIAKLKRLKEIEKQIQD